MRKKKGGGVNGEYLLKYKFLIELILIITISRNLPPRAWCVVYRNLEEVSDRLLLVPPISQNLEGCAKDMSNAKGKISVIKER